MRAKEAMVVLWWNFFVCCDFMTFRFLPLTEKLIPVRFWSLSHARTGFVVVVAFLVIDHVCVCILEQYFSSRYDFLDISLIILQSLRESTEN